MDINNLTNVYNQNPTLQGQYSLQQYIDLFGGSSTPATTTTATTTTPTPNPGIPNIINSNINQYQNQGGNGGGGLTLNAPRTARAAPINSAAFRDPLNQKIMDQIRNEGMTIKGKNVPYSNRTYENQLNKYTDAEFMEANPDMFDIKTDRGFFQNTVDNIGSGIGSAYKSFKQSPIGIGMSFMNPVSAMASVAGMMGRKDVSEIDAAFNKSGDMYTSEGGIGNKDKYGINKVSALGNYADYVGKTADKTAEAYAAAVEKYTKMGLTPTQIATKTKNLRERNEFYEAEKQRKIDAENKAKDRAAEAKKNAIIARTSQAYYDRAVQNAAGRDSNQGNSVTGYGNSGLGRDPDDRMADGGVVSLKDGGSTNGSGEKAFSAKVKELMDDGYEFGEAVKEATKQGYMNGGRIKSYFKGGLVSLRGK